MLPAPYSKVKHKNQEDFRTSRSANQRFPSTRISTIPLRNLEQRQAIPLGNYSRLVAAVAQFQSKSRTPPSPATIPHQHRRGHGRRHRDLPSGLVARVALTPVLTICYDVPSDRRGESLPHHRVVATERCLEKRIIGSPGIPHKGGVSARIAFKGRTPAHISSGSTAVELLLQRRVVKHYHE